MWIHLRFKGIEPTYHELRFPIWANYICLLSKYLVQGLFHYSHGGLIQQCSSISMPSCLLHSETQLHFKTQPQAEFIPYPLWIPGWPRLVKPLVSCLPSITNRPQGLQKQGCWQGQCETSPPTFNGPFQSWRKQELPSTASVSDYLRREDFILAWLLFVLKVALQNSPSPSVDWISLGPRADGIDLYTQC